MKDFFLLLCQTTTGLGCILSVRGCNMLVMVYKWNSKWVPGDDVSQYITRLLKCLTRNRTLTTITAVSETKIYWAGTILLNSKMHFWFIGSLHRLAPSPPEHIFYRSKKKNNWWPTHQVCGRRRLDNTREGSCFWTLSSFGESSSLMEQRGIRY